MTHRYSVKEPYVDQDGYVRLPCPFDHDARKGSVASATGTHVAKGTDAAPRSAKAIAFVTLPFQLVVGRRKSGAQSRTLSGLSSSDLTYTASAASTNNWAVVMANGEAMDAARSTLACSYAGCFISYIGGSFCF